MVLTIRWYDHPPPPTTTTHHPPPPTIDYPMHACLHGLQARGIIHITAEEDASASVSGVCIMQVCVCGGGDAQ